MADKTWMSLKTHYCDHACAQVSLDAEIVYPAEFLPDQSPRVVAHRCSQGVECSMQQKAACIWAGTNPTYDPFSEK